MRREDAVLHVDLLTCGVVRDARPVVRARDGAAALPAGADPELLAPRGGEGRTWTFTLPLN